MAVNKKKSNKGIPEPGLIRKPLKYLPEDMGAIIGKKSSRKINTQGQ